MPGTFSGLTDDEWAILCPFLPQDPPKRGKGLPHAPWRDIFNTIAYVAITGARWCDIPVGPGWGKRSTSHRWLGIWKADGTWDHLKTHLLTAASLAERIDWNRASVDGSFSPWKGRRRDGCARVQGQGGHTAQPRGRKRHALGGDHDPGERL